MSSGSTNVGDLIFGDIDENPYLRHLYSSLLRNYSIVRLRLQEQEPEAIDLHDALRFADLLSKSPHPTRRDEHRVWAQEIAVLCQTLYPENVYTRFYVPAIFTTLGNYPALHHLDVTSNVGVLNATFNAYQAEYLSIPTQDGKKFFAPQKQIFDKLSEDHFSFAAPTSLGKSFIMRTFVRTQIESGVKANFAIIVPTKALINETRSKLIEDLGESLEKHDYRIVSAVGDIVLESQHNFIFVLTPERLLYLLIGKPAIEFDYVFFDESHKLSGKNSRAPFYYQTVTMLQQRERPPHFIFSAPNIPNPEVFLRLVDPGNELISEHSMSTRYSPVVQFKYLVDMQEGTISSYNERTGSFAHVANITSPETTVADLTHFITRTTLDDKGVGQTLIFHSSKQKAVDGAQKYASALPPLKDSELEQLAKDIERDIHEDYYLCDLVRKGVGYHIGYLPPSIRERLESLFKQGKITALFCTSTLLEGVNLPADNLIITTDKIGLATMTAVDFKNLVGRVGRIEFNLYGNVFVVAGDKLASHTTARALLKSKVTDQKLSIETDPKILSSKLKQGIVETLREGDIEFTKGDGETFEIYGMKRKFSLILLRDLLTDRTSLVRDEFGDFLDDQVVAQIQAAFASRAAHQDDDINISPDQTESLVEAIQAGLSYPKLSPDGKFNYEETVAFLNRLAAVFKWRIYEPQTLGSASSSDGELKKLRWYAVLLTQWMEGHGLRSIMTRALQYRLENRVFHVRGQRTYYNDQAEHRNVVFSEILEVIENVILFSLSNYFLKFSNEYKRIHNVTQFENDWYEYVEYGTTKAETIMLQRVGFTRESATYIRRNHPNAILIHEGQPYLSPALLESTNVNVAREANEIKYNVPEAFSWPKFMF